MQIQKFKNIWNLCSRVRALRTLLQEGCTVTDGLTLRSRSRSRGRRVWGRNRRWSLWWWDRGRGRGTGTRPRRTCRSGARHSERAGAQTTGSKWSNRIRIRKGHVVYILKLVCGAEMARAAICIAGLKRSNVCDSIRVQDLSHECKHLIWA